MTPERWRRIEDLFHAAQERAPGERDAFLALECAGDAVLRQEVQSLLAQHDGTLLREGIGVAAAELATPPPRPDHEGRALGPYVLGPLLGSGGMGDVYRASDARLGRDVAVKILPDAVSQDAGRLARFEREARILAALNHPHIGAIYGVEERDGLRGLVLELVDGDTLADKLRRGGARREATALPLDEALAIARQIAEALAAAHDKGIVHRDLKPANIKITPQGVVKVLDFGLAKSEVPEPSQTAVLPLLATGDGVILGTVAYMSPEQARGLPVDKRTDIWAFGCVLYEMLAGARAFPGDTSADVLGAITVAEPDWTRLPPETPARVRDLLRRCLAKDPNRRLHHIADARIEIDEAIGSPPAADAAAPRSRRSPAARRLVLWIAAGLITATAAAVWFGIVGTRSALQSPSLVSIELPAAVSVAIGRGSSVAVSPDGRRIVYAAAVNNGTQLYVRLLAGLDNSPIAGTEGGTNPFFSPDGRWIAFHADDKIRKVPIDGGVATTVAEPASYLGAAWGPDGTLLYVPNPNGHSGVWRVPVDGGKGEPVTTVGEGTHSHQWPQWLPDGKAVLFTMWNNTSFDGGRIAVQSLEGGEPTILVERASHGRVVVLDGGRAYLVYARPEGLLAAPFDLDRRRLAGLAVPVQDGVLVNLSGGAHFSSSSDGTLAYLPGGLDEVNKTLLWVDQDGRSTVVAPSIPGIGFQYRLAPDGRRIVRPNGVGPDRDLWIDDLGRGRSTRLTFNAQTQQPIWTYDGRRVIYAAGLPIGNLYWRAADGSGAEERLTTSPNEQVAGSATADGTLVYFERNPKTGFDIWAMPLNGTRTLRPVIVTPKNEGNPRISPDGRWLTYQSNVSGQVEAHVASFPDGNRRLQVSKDGGFTPIWSPDGRELYYRTRNSPTASGEMMAVSIDTTSGEPKIGTPRVLFPAAFQGNGDIAPDGRFLLLQPTPKQSTARGIQLVLNWFDDLQAKAPAR